MILSLLIQEEYLLISCFISFIKSLWFSLFRDCTFFFLLHSFLSICGFCYRCEWNDFPVSTSRCWCQCPSRKHKEYSSGVTEKGLNRKCLQDMGRSKGSHQWAEQHVGVSSKGLRGSSRQNVERKLQLQDRTVGGGGSHCCATVHRKGDTLALPPPTLLPPPVLPIGWTQLEGSPRRRESMQVSRARWEGPCIRKADEQSSAQM